MHCLKMANIAPGACKQISQARTDDSVVKNTLFGIVNVATASCCVCVCVCLTTSGGILVARLWIAFPRMHKEERTNTIPRTTHALRTQRRRNSVLGISCDPFTDLIMRSRTTASNPNKMTSRELTLIHFPVSVSCLLLLFCCSHKAKSICSIPIWATAMRDFTKTASRCAAHVRLHSCLPIILNFELWTGENFWTGQNYSCNMSGTVHCV